MAKREGKPIQVSRFILENIIGKKPRKPATYEMRKKRNEKGDKEFCDDYDTRIEEWEKKAEIERKRVLKEREKDREALDNFKVKEVPAINATVADVIADFMVHYKIVNKKDFSKSNPYSGTDEPLQYLYTLVYYFLRDDRFYKSPLLRKDLSVPSLDKGTITIGGYGCGKTSTWEALLATFRTHVKYCKQKMPKNLRDITDRLDINSCISSEVVMKYNLTKDKSMINELLNPLLSPKKLYIDDILREENASNFGTLNIFKQVLTHRADRSYPSHLTMNFLEEFEKKGNVLVPIQNTEKSLMQYRERYDGRVHDRLFGGFNIIELRGKSFRR